MVSFRSKWSLASPSISFKLWLAERFRVISTVTHPDPQAWPPQTLVDVWTRLRPGSPELGLLCGRPRERPGCGQPALIENHMLYQGPEARRCHGTEAAHAEGTMDGRVKPGYGFRLLTLWMARGGEAQVPTLFTVSRQKPGSGPAGI